MVAKKKTVLLLVICINNFPLLLPFPLLSLSPLQFSLVYRLLLLPTIQFAITPDPHFLVFLTKEIAAQLSSCIYFFILTCWVSSFLLSLVFHFEFLDGKTQRNRKGLNLIFWSLSLLLHPDNLSGTLPFLSAVCSISVF